MNNKFRYRIRIAAAIVAALSIATLISCLKKPATSSDTVTVTLGYNSFLSDSFTDAPAPIDVIRAELAKKHPEITLEYYVMPQDLLESLVLWMTSKDKTVDIYGMDVPWVNQFGRAGWAEPLNELIPNLGDLIVDAGLNVFSYRGSRLAVPFWGGVAGLYYRADILSALGIEPPRTIDDMVSAILAVNDAKLGISGFVWPGQKEESLNMFYATLLYAFGGTYVRPDGSYAFDSEASRQAIAFMQDSVKNGWSPREVLAWTRLESRQRFVEGTALFSWDNHDIITWLDDESRSRVAGKWGFMPFPAQPEGESVAITGGFGFALNPYSDKKRAAAQVLELIAGREVQKGFALAWGPVQHAEGLYEDPEVRKYNPNVDMLGPLLERSMNRPPSDNYARLSQLMLEELTAALATGADPSMAAKQLQSRARILLKE